MQLIFTKIKEQTKGFILLVFRKPPDCHHATRLPHRCHFGYCPPCKQICDKMLSCGHHCPSVCHTAVL